MAWAGRTGRALAAAALLASAVGALRHRPRPERITESNPGHDSHDETREDEIANWLAHIGPQVRQRLSDQAADHWKEFSVIIAGGSIAIALGAGGLLFAQSVDAGGRVLIGGMLLASVASFTLAYFSIQIGSLILVGPLTFMEVMASFAIAAPQVAMPLWLGYTLRQHPRIDRVDLLLPDSMHWFGLLACFAVAASFANFYEARRRRRTDCRAPESVENAQLADRVGALVDAIILSMIWALRSDIPWMAAAVLAYLQAAVLIAVMANQSRTTRLLIDAVEANA